MWKKTCGVVSALLLLVGLVACATSDDLVGSGQPETGMGTSESDDSSSEDLNDWVLSEGGEEIVYSESIKGNRYRPISVQYSNQTAPVSSWSTANTRILKYLSGYDPEVTSYDRYREITNKYGSYTQGEKYESTGRFRIQKDANGFFWFVDPDGYPLFMRGVSSFQPGGNSLMYQTLFNGSFESLISFLQPDLAKLGIHSTAAFASGYESGIDAYDKAHSESPLVQAPSFGFLRGFRKYYGYDYPGGDSAHEVAMLFYGGWEDYCRWFVRNDAQFKLLIGNKDVFGFFSDNELKFSQNNTMLLKSLLGMTDHTDAAYRAARDFMDERGASTVTSALNDEFAGMVAEMYYRGIAEAVDEVDSKLLYLGSRLHGTPKYMEHVVKAAGKYCDVISINYYNRWSPEKEWLSNWALWAPQTPFMITEFYTKSTDGNNCQNTGGAGFMVPGQIDRAYAYQHFTLGLLESPNCVGWIWFRLQDDEDNKGIYNVDYVKYPLLEKAMRSINYNVYSLRGFLSGISL